jgi:hypothetical protein
VKLFRVCPHDPSAPRGTPGHPLFVPAIQGAGRLDNADLYEVLYVADAPEAAVAERFGNLAVWTDAMLAPPRSLSRGAMSLVEYDAEKVRVQDLDDASELVRLSLRPSEVVTRDRARTQRWAAGIWRENRWDGIRWWSYYASHWGSFGLWTHSKLRVSSVTPLSRSHPAVVAAGATVVRAWL